MQGQVPNPASNLQPTLKFNLGSGNNFIVKNSNIVITQGAANPGAASNNGLSLQQQQAMIFAQSNPGSSQNKN
jgi:hypothetical protein